MAGGENLIVSKTNIESLPDDLLFSILIHLPAQHIYDAARFVCHKWSNIIHTSEFVDAHFERSSSGLLIHCMSSNTVPYYAEIRNGRVQTSKLNGDFKNKLRGGWNGLIVQPGFVTNEGKLLYIENPTTKRQFPLPLFCLGKVGYYGIAYAPASKKYKVVLTYDCGDGTRCAILTVGVDNTWRHVDIHHLSVNAPMGFDRVASITEGFMHWDSNSTHIWTLNIESEKITENPAPQVYYYESANEYYLSSESCLSRLYSCSKFSWELWEMKSETGEWMKVGNIDLEAHKRTFKKYSRHYDGLWHDPEPVGWLKDREVLVFHVCSRNQFCIFCIAYNVCTQAIDLFEVDSSRWGHIFHVHRNSLKWLS